jgi:hypothetical protein
MSSPFETTLLTAVLVLVTSASAWGESAAAQSPFACRPFSASTFSRHTLIGPERVATSRGSMPMVLVDTDRLTELLGLSRGTGPSAVFALPDGTADRSWLGAYADNLVVALIDARDPPSVIARGHPTAPTLDLFPADASVPRPTRACDTRSCWVTGMEVLDAATIAVRVVRREAYSGGGGVFETTHLFRRNGDVLHHLLALPSAYDVMYGSPPNDDGTVDHTAMYGALDIQYVATGPDTSPRIVVRPAGRRAERVLSWNEADATYRCR